MLERSKDHARETGPALESHFRFILWMVTAVTRFPRAHKFLLGDRIQGAAMDVLESLIEATYTRRRDAHLARANLGVEKLRIFFRLARDLRCLDTRRYEHAARYLDDTANSTQCLTCGNIVKPLYSLHGRYDAETCRMGWIEQGRSQEVS